MSDISDGVLGDETYLEQGGDEEGLSFLNSGLGLNISYDTRESQRTLTKASYMILNTRIMQKHWAVILHFPIYPWNIVTSWLLIL